MSAAMEVQVPESQRLIAVSLGKIAMSRGQKGGINLHKNLLVATVLHKARTAYMIQQFARQRASQSPSPPPTTTTTAATSSPLPPSNVEMREQQPSGEVSEPSSNTTTTYSSSSSSQSSLSSSSSVTSATAAPTFSSAAPSSSPAAPPVAGVAAPPAESGSLPLPDGADVSSVQVVECEDKENTPPPSPSPIGDAAQCEKRLQGENKNTIKDSEKNTVLPLSKPRHGTSVTQKSARGDYVSNKGCSSCLLKRRRVMSSDHENVSAPKVRIVDTRLSPKQQDSTPEPMQCDSPQISNLVNIFSSSFAGLSGAGGEPSVRSVTVVGLSVSTTHKLSDNTCAQEMMVGLDSVRQSLVLSV